MTPLLRHHKVEDEEAAAESNIHETASCRGGQGDGGSLRMVLLFTALAVCGSFKFGACVGYSAPTKSPIADEIGLSISELQANVGRKKEFHTSLQKLQGLNAAISEESIEIKEYIETLRSFQETSVQDLFIAKNIYAVIIPVTLFGAILMDRSGNGFF